MISSKQLTTDLMAYLRFQRRIFLLATEVKYNKCRSDVLALDNKNITEFEVKVSKADFLKDFEKQLTTGWRKWKTKVSKHAMYNGTVETTKTYFAPHYFYFVVPESLAAFVKEKCAEYPSYGVMSWSLDNKYRIKVEKTARALNKEPLNKKVMQKILQRATSELVKLRAKLYSTELSLPEEEDLEEADQEELSLPSPEQEIPT
jgi:hypothetical protein